MGRHRDWSVTKAQSAGPLHNRYQIIDGAKSPLSEWKPNGNVAHCALAVFQSHGLGPRPSLSYTRPHTQILGVNSDTKLKFSRKIFRLRAIAKITVTISSATSEVTSHISFRINYCYFLYYDISQTSISRLQPVQNDAARLLTQAKKREHISPILAAQHWLPVYCRIWFKISLPIKLCMVASISDLPSCYLTSLSLRSSNKTYHHHLSLPHQQTPEFLRTRRTSHPKVLPEQCGDRAFSFAATIFWLISDQWVFLKRDNKIIFVFTCIGFRCY